MALIVADRVQELTTTSGTGTLTLNGAVSGFQTFSNGIGNTNTTYYTIYDSTAYVWEVGIGTVGAGTLSRDTVLANSLGTTAKINLAGNQASVFCTYPADKSVNLDASGNVTPLGTISSGTWQGTTIGVAYGGTGVTTSSGANSVVLRDSNQNVTVNRLNQSNTTVTAAGGTTALTAASSYSQTLVGTGNQTYTMPDATTLTTGVDFVFNNNATGLLTIRDNASGLLGTVTAGGAAAIMLLDNGTVAGTWNLHGFLPESVTWGTNALDLGTTIVSNGTWQGGTIQSGYGGTGLTTFVAANNALYSTSASALTAGTLPILAGGTGATTAPNARTNLGATTVGSNLFTLTNPSAITFPRFNADNTVSALNATDFRTAIGAGTGSGDVVGPASATDNAIARFDGTTGKLIQNSAVTIADDGATVIDVNSTSDALRITQTGTGNAILVEDSANPDASPFAVDATGNVLIGDTISRTIPNVTTSKLQVSSEAGNGFVAGLSAVAWDSGSNALAAPVISFAKSDSDITGTQTIVAVNDVLGTISFSGSDGTNFRAASYIQSYVDGTPGTNDMPGRLTLSTTADGASTPTERMRIDSAGQVGIGTTSLTGYNFRLGKNLTGAVTSIGADITTTVQSDVTTNATGYRTQLSTAAASFTLGSLTHYSANQITIGAGSTVTNQYGFLASSSLIGATNDFGFYSDIASGTGRWNFYANGTADNYFAGNTGVGRTPNAAVRLDVGGTYGTGAAESYGAFIRGTSPSTTTSNLYGIASQQSTQDAAFTLTNLRHFGVFQGTITGGSRTAPTNQVGYFVDAGLTGATNNYGFFSGIASGTGRWNFYANGTAANYFAGTTLIGNTTDRGGSLQLAGSTSAAATTQRITGFAFDSRLRLGRANAAETVVASGDSIGILAFDGYDGAAYLAAAQISAVVDNTPGTNDMPGRLVFSTTADGASSPTERLRISSAGGWGLSGANYGTSGQVLTSNGDAPPTWTTISSGSGDVVGPASATDNAIARFDGTTGKLIQNSALTVADTTGSLDFTANNARILGNFGAGSTSVHFQNRGTNQPTFVSAIPSGSGGSAGFVAIPASNLAVDYQYMFMSMSTVGAGISVARTGAGASFVPFSIEVGGSERLRITTAGGIAFNGSTNYGTSGQVLTSNGDAPPTWVDGVTASSTTTFTNKTLNGAVLNDGYTEEVYAVVDAATPTPGVALSPTNGSIQTWTLGGNRTPTAGTWAEGQSITLMINDSASSFTVTWTSLPVTWVGGTAPSLAPASGFTIITLWKVGTTIYGALVGQVT